MVETKVLVQFTHDAVCDVFNDVLLSGVLCMFAGSGIPSAGPVLYGLFEQFVKTGLHHGAREVMIVV